MTPPLGWPRSHGCSSTHLSLVLRLQPQPRLDAAPRLQEGLALGAVRQVADEDPGGVHAHEQNGLSRHLRTDGRRCHGNGQTLIRRLA